MYHVHIYVYTCQSHRYLNKVRIHTHIRKFVSKATISSKHMVLRQSCTKIIEVYHGPAHSSPNKHVVLVYRWSVQTLFTVSE